MSAETKANSPRVTIGMVNMFGSDTLYAPALPIGYHTRITKEAKADGAELWVLNGMPSAQLRWGIISKETKTAILSAHQSIAGVYKGTNEAPNTLEAFKMEKRHLGFLTAAGIWVLLPQRDISLTYLKNLQTHTGNIPLVVYSETPQQVLLKSGVANLVTEITSETYRHGSYGSLNEYLDDLDERNIGYCIDTHHIRKWAEDTPFEDWRNTVQTILRRAEEKDKKVHVHVATGRVENSDPGIDTQKEQRNLRNGVYNGDLFEMVDMIKESGRANLYVIETPLGSLKAVNGAGLATRKVFVEEFKRMTASLKNFLAK